MPESWNGATARARRLAAAIRYLPWIERAYIFDAFFWNEAQSRLAEREITAVVNRRSHSLAGSSSFKDYVYFCRAVVTATLQALDDALSIQDEAAALIHFFSLNRAHQEAAVSWIGEDHHEELIERLPSWPGCAFLLLALSPNDSAESFIARDAFRTAILGQG